MRPAWRWTGIAAAGLLGIAVLGYIVVYAISERVLRRTYPSAPIALAVPTDPQSVQEGRRIATVHGCVHDCHGKEGEGRVMFDDPKLARIVAPNLTAAVRRYTDEQLAVLIRNGIRPDGRSLIVMPVEAYIGMTDADLGRIIAFLKSLPPVPGPAAHIEIGPLGRLGVALGKFRTAAQLISLSVPPPSATSQEAELGRYLARTVCAECHGTSLHGDVTPEFTSPDLRVVAAYDPESFTRLLRSGVALGGRQLGMMSEQARNNLAQLTDWEISTLYSYLHNLPAAAH
jgi:cytochrome c553